MTDYHPITHAQSDGAVILERPSCETFEHDLYPATPEGPIESWTDLPCEIALKASPAFETWATENAVTFRFGFHETENFPQIELGNQAQADLFIKRWVPEPA